MAPTGDLPRNAPGQAAISHRPGGYGTFLTDMLTALSRQPGLRSLTTRDPSDPMIALLEAWAAVGEVLAFQGERFAQEGFLPTATTRDAVLLHARALGYELRPGLSAHTTLAFSLDLPPDGPDEVTLAPGIAVQSVPGPDEEPQWFETVEELVAHRDLDDLRPARTERVLPRAGDDEVTLAGTETRLEPGDRLLLIGAGRLTGTDPSRWDLVRVAEATAVPPDPRDPVLGGYTTVRLESALAHVDPTADPGGSELEVYALRAGVPLFGNVAPPWSTLSVALRIGEVQPGTTSTVVAGPYAGRQNTWVDAALAATTTTLELARRVNGLVAPAWAVLTGPKGAELLEVTGVGEATLADYLLTSESSVLTVVGTGFSAFDRRSSVVWCRSEPLSLGARPLESAVSGSVIPLEVAVPALAPGRSVVVEGVRTDTGEPDAEVAEVYATTTATGADGAPVTVVTLATDLTYTYERASTHVRANVAAATHGQTRRVVLGSGDGTRTFQRFVLPEAGLTFVPPALAAEPSPLEVVRGAATTLEIRVDGQPWEQVPTLYEQPADARVCTARARPGDGRVVVTFGDGVQGARLPSGRDNVSATYRVGTGAAGQVDAGQLTLLLSRPLGLTGVRNPVPAIGAAEPEPLTEARRNAPVAVRTLDRLVSLRDVEDLARSRAGVAKASAAWVWRGDERVVHVTVAPADGTVLAATDPLLGAIADALESARHPGGPIVVAPHEDVSVAVTAGVVVDGDHEAEPVLAAARAAVEQGFSFGSRDLSRPLAASEVVAVLHTIPGVVAVDMDAFHPVGHPVQRLALIPGRPAAPTSAGIRSAELVRVDSAHLVLTEVTR